MSHQCPITDERVMAIVDNPSLGNTLTSLSLYGDEFCHVVSCDI